MKDYVWKLKFAADQPRVPEGSPEGGQWTAADDVTWAQGVVAARYLGGQVAPQRAVSQAERILSQAGLRPTERKVPAGATMDYFKKFYTEHMPVIGDVWTGPKGLTITVSKIDTTLGSATNSIAIDAMFMTPREGRIRTIWVDAERASWAAK